MVIRYKRLFDLKNFTFFLVNCIAVCLYWPKSVLCFFFRSNYFSRQLENNAPLHFCGSFHTVIVLLRYMNWIYHIQQMTSSAGKVHYLEPSKKKYEIKQIKKNLYKFMIRKIIWSLRIEKKDPSLSLSKYTNFEAMKIDCKSFLAT